MIAVRIVEHITVSGVVQGVGFRPFVHRLATELGLDGSVGNDSTQVFIDVAGPPDHLDTFVERLQREAPPLARIDSIQRRTNEHAVDEPGFRIVASEVASGDRTLVAPDTAPCADCLRELFDPEDRRYLHPFITCTNCGPRFTIISALPYDRPSTTMAGFEMCRACRAEYSDPSDRRFHAQPIGCHRCGPRLWFRSLRPAGVSATGRSDDPIGAAAAALGQGDIIAIKGLGGYNLACDATEDRVVDLLRARKQRPDKPFAVMVGTLEVARQLAEISQEEAALLESPAAPIVLLRSRADSPASASVTRGNPLIGLMLPNTPVHHLLFARHHRPLVMTSANRSGEPIAHHHNTVMELADVFDGLLDHDRPIEVPCDDSVVRIVDGRLLPIRRSRGYAPLPVRLPPTERSSSVLAVGAEIKNTFCVSNGHHAWVGPHIGDMENVATLDAFERMVDRFIDFYDLDPDVVAVDDHPAYLVSRWGRRHHGDRVVSVQHHHAHVAAVMAEHHLDPTIPVLGFAFDGTGYGTDGTIWGGEVLAATAAGFDRVAALSPVLLPGGDAGVRHTARTALAHLHAAGLLWHDDVPSTAALDRADRQLLRQQLVRGVACATSTSMGRLFDAVASLVGLRHEISYEAQAAIELEVAADRGRPPSSSRAAVVDSYRFGLHGPEIGVRPVLRDVVRDVLAGDPADDIAWRFHDAVAEVVHRVAVRQRAETGIGRVALSGGTFQNALLTTMCTRRLEASGFTVLTHSIVPPNDGGLSLGQAWIAANRPLREGL